MAADGMIGNGVRIGFREIASPENAWTVVGEVLNVGDLEIVRSKVDRSVHGTSIYKRSLPGMAEISDILLEILADPDESIVGTGDQQQDLREYVVSGETLEWRVEIPTTRDQAKFKPVEFDAYVLSYTMGLAREDGQVFKVTLAFDGDSFTESTAVASASSELA
jgi:hypothetical protein